MSYKWQTNYKIQIHLESNQISHMQKNKPEWFKTFKPISKHQNKTNKETWKNMNRN
jgi:hypothetical protein